MLLGFTSSLPLFSLRPITLHSLPSTPFPPSVSKPRPYSRCTIPTMQSDNRLAVMVNGVPGRMAAATAEQVIQRGLILADEALTGPNVSPLEYQASESTTVTLARPEDHVACLRRMRERYPRLVVVDYTHPSAANPNVEKYVGEGLGFVIGTTGGDVDRMKRAVMDSESVYAVIAPNMGKQIVAFQAMMEMMAREFPGAFAGYQLNVKESHQSTKADTSGTAKSVVSSFKKLGLPFDVEDIEKVRERDRSIKEMHVPEDFISAGHAFHTYHLTSSDGSVNFEFQHNVCGRVTYADGTVDAALFLDSQRQKGVEKRIFDMIDILRSGEMS